VIMLEKMYKMRYSRY